jgi:hypothetical protein
MMNRNQKIAIGCGAGGCLGVILLVILVAVLIVSGVIKAPGIYSPSSRNYNYNYNSNYNSNNNANTNDNTNSNSSPSSSMSEDDKHKLFQAAGMTKDNALVLRVLRKIGYPLGSGEGYQQFLSDHIPWAQKNMTFVRSVIDADKARAYVDAHIDD